jgi:anti-sigma factor RsiW
VKDLAQDGFPLVGGRLEYLRDRPIAALVYRRAQHVVNLFVWPTRGLKVAATSKRGVSAVTWDEGDLRFCAISEAPRAELEGFSRAFREQRQQ